MLLVYGIFMVFNMRWFILFSILVSGLHAYSQNPYPQEYDGYRSWSTFNQDTVRYLQYNWGLKVVGVYNDVPLSDFFDVFELPICDVEIRCTTPGGRAEVGYIRFWLQPYEKAYKEWKESGEYSSKYNIIVYSILPEIDKYSMLYEDLQPYIPSLKRDGITIVPWKDSYKEVLGSFIASGIRYLYGV